MDHPTLQLTVDKGPRKGETLECKPGAVAHIGRVVRGNTLAVRDPGISQKHLAFQFLPDVSRWAVSDLDTSNGTLVNDRQIPPSSPFPLSHGDTVKIGESTAISVKILAPERRDLDDGDGVGDGGDEKERSGVVPRRGRSRRGAPPLPAVEESATGAVEGGSVRRGRGRSKKGPATAAVPNKDEMLEPPALEESATGVAEGGRGRKGRGGPKKGTATSAVPKKDEILEPPTGEENTAGAEEGGYRRKGRERSKKGAATATVRKKDEILESPTVEGSVEVEAKNLMAAKGRMRGRRPRTRSAAAKVSKGEEEKEEPQVSVQVADPEVIEVVDSAEKGNANVEGDASEEAVDSGKAEEPTRGEEEVGEDMEKMTLGEWFDQMEKILPQMINDVANEITASLTDKAQRFNEFIATSSTSH